MSDTSPVLISPDGLIHFPDENGEVALCGLAAPLERQDRPNHWAGVWCSGCMRAAAGIDLDARAARGRAQGR